jgi:hypothetical protein
MCGINSVVLFFAKKDQYHDDICPRHSGKASVGEEVGELFTNEAPNT